MAIDEKADGNTAWGNDYRSVVRRVNALTSDSTGKIPPGQLAVGVPGAGVFVRGDGQFAAPQLWTPWVAQDWAASLTINAAAGTKRIIVAGGDFTLQEPASPAEGQPLLVRTVASGAQRVVTFVPAIRRATGIVSTLTIPAGQRGDAAMMYEAAYGWTLFAAAVS